VRRTIGVLVLGGAICAATSAMAAPDAYTVVQRIPLANAGFESEARGPRGDPEGWLATQHAGEVSYRFTVDTAEHHEGSRSLRIENIGKEPFGALEQSLPATAFQGRTIRYSAWLKTRGASGKGASLVASAEGMGALVAHNFMTDEEVTGTQDWRKVAITLAIPAYAGSVRVGVMLQGPGTVWFDAAELEIVTAAPARQ